MDGNTVRSASSSVSQTRKGGAHRLTPSVGATGSVITGRDLVRVCGKAGPGMDLRLEGRLRPVCSAFYPYRIPKDVDTVNINQQLPSISNLRPANSGA